MFEKNEVTNKIEFSHNPFSMPQGDLKDIDFDNPLNIKAYQYDIVCNGIELSSGAIRNHVPELMYKLFSIAGYQKNKLMKNLVE
jgi:aspartyl-tRNA synthetase